MNKFKIIMIFLIVGNILISLNAKELSQITKLEVQKVVKDIFYLLQYKKYKEFNKTYIHPAYGFGDLYAQSANGEIFVYKDITELSKNTRMEDEPLYLENFESVRKKIHWGEIEFDDVNWSKNGVYISNKPYYNNIQTAYWSKSYFDLLNKTDIKNVKLFSKDIFVVTNTKNDIIFHIKQIDGRWYVVLFDRIYTNRDT